MHVFQRSGVSWARFFLAHHHHRLQEWEVGRVVRVSPRLALLYHPSGRVAYLPVRQPPMSLLNLLIAAIF